jgi:hypothetical protein
MITQGLLLCALTAGWAHLIPDWLLGLCCTACAAMFLLHEPDAPGMYIKGADVVCECVIFFSDCLEERSRSRVAADWAAVALNAVNAASFLRAYVTLRGGEWWLLCEAVNSATDLVACWLEASGRETPRTEDTCLLILACIAALLLADEIHGAVRIRGRAKHAKLA